MKRFIRNVLLGLFFLAVGFLGTIAVQHWPQWRMDLISNAPPKAGTIELAAPAVTEAPVILRAREWRDRAAERLAELQRRHVQLTESRLQVEHLLVQASRSGGDSAARALLSQELVQLDEDLDSISVSIDVAKIQFKSAQTTLAQAQAGTIESVPISPVDQWEQQQKKRKENEAADKVRRDAALHAQLEEAKQLADQKADDLAKQKAITLMEQARLRKVQEQNEKLKVEKEAAEEQARREETRRLVAQIDAQREKEQREQAERETQIARTQAEEAKRLYQQRPSKSVESPASGWSQVNNRHAYRVPPTMPAATTQQNVQQAMNAAAAQSQRAVAEATRQMQRSLPTIVKPSQKPTRTIQEGTIQIIPGLPPVRFQYESTVKPPQGSTMSHVRFLTKEQTEAIRRQSEEQFLAERRRQAENDKRILK